MASIKDKINAIRKGTGIGSKDDLAALEKAQRLWQDMYDVATARQNEKVEGKEVEKGGPTARDKAEEIRRTAAHFAEETAEEAAAFDKRVAEMDDAELLAYMREDGKGDVNKAHHPSVYDEYDYRHGGEQADAYERYLKQLEDSGTTLEQAEEMLGNLQKDKGRLATEDRADLLGQEEALLDYIAGLEKIHYDKQGNPVDGDGKLILEKTTINGLTGEDFSNPSRSVELPKIPDNVDKAIGAKGKPVIIKKNIFEKNKANHPELKPSQSKMILANALYSTNLYGQTQPLTRPNYWVVIRTSDPNKVAVLEVSEKKDNVEIVGWRYAGERQLEELRKQSEREDGQLLILTSDKEAAAGLSTLPSDVSAFKGTDSSSNPQEKIGESDADARLSVRNTGYTTRDDGTSLSNRAKDAEDEGSFTAGKFKSRYKISGDAFDALEKLGVVEKSEWHHTGKRFKESDFFSWKDSDHIGGDTDYGAGEQAGLHARYMENKKEIDRLAADFKKRSWEYEDEEPVREMSYDQFCGERYRRLPVLSREEYLTEEQKREKERLHAEISGNERGLSSYGRYLEHRDIDERYDGMAFENYKKAEEETLRPEYAELERENAARLERNRTLDERNARTEGKEAAAMRMLELMGYGHDDALREVKSASKIGKRQEAMERREQRRKEAEAEYEKKAAVIDGKREKWLADYMKKGKVREVTRVPSGEAPENFVETKREMNGRYGWFESSARYNLPEYVSGYAFDSKRLADSYRKFDERKNDAYRELVSGADLDFDPVETARRNSEMRRSEQEGADARFSISDDLTAKYGDRWLTEQTNDDGRHTTQVKNTINSYKKFGDWVREDSKGEPVSILDASSGLGLGTEWMRENGMMVDDVEPYPSENRIAPTYKSYADIDKKYDYIISNAVLNVIPDDWRAGLLHDMADKLNVGGKLVINVRGAESIRKQGIEGKTRITLDDPSEILVLRPDGSIKAYQKGFTKAELKAWCEDELGGGYSVEIANKKNAGGSYDTAVVVTKNNESTTNGSASELGQPIREDAALANVGAKIANNSERTKRLDKLSLEIDKNGALGSHQLLHEINVVLNTEMSEEDGRRLSTDRSMYYDLGGGVSLRVSDHQGDASTFLRHNHPNDNYGIVIKLSRSRFKVRDGVDYIEYVYYGDRIGDAGRQSEIVEGLRDFLSTGDFGALPHPDRINPSGKFKKKGNGNEDARLSVRDDVRFSLGDRLSDPIGSVRGAVERVGKAEDRERDVKEQFDRTRQRGIDTADRILDDATATDKQRHQRMTDVIREVTRIDGLRKAGKETVRERVRSIADTLTEMIPATDEFTRGEVKRLIGKIDKAMDVKDVKRNVREAVNIVLKSAERDVDAETMRLRKTKGKRLDADSQLKQGQLDLKGQHVLDEFNRVADDVAVDLDQLEQQYAGEMGNMDLSEVQRANAADKLDGVKLAQLYRKSVKEKDQNISELNEMKRAEEEKIYNFKKRLVFDADGNVVRNKRTGEVRTETVKTPVIQSVISNSFWGCN